MDEKLRHLLITLQDNDYKWIAGDKDGTVLAYKVKPKKNQNNGWWDSKSYDWIILNDFSNVDLSIFQWKDRSPRSNIQIII
ncbi:MAG: hypothetical protein LUF02_05980 [Erysipelotrichaceae bacterium]|nr:hypothetical protein [Erysipelotrichaceae bacterium]